MTSTEDLQPVVKNEVLIFFKRPSLMNTTLLAEFLFFDLHEFQQKQQILAGKRMSLIYEQEWKSLFD